MFLPSNFHLSVMAILKSQQFVIRGSTRSGWDETANTWEPQENLVCVANVEAFERSLRSTKYRKRRRRHGDGSSLGRGKHANDDRSANVSEDNRSVNVSKEDSDDELYANDSEEESEEESDEERSANVSEEDTL
ncbi:hypothetical protein KIW84_012784 [Lathyrus oleraceus]|uniref:Chromo domain-containing protein n=1 Tax=Pisum sativum TaxID=3888 RepID=A0A9D5BID5_PEA|nr:hypothetical protein KIW84_012784 [Pisum sativum]